jgi:hypothetical protein
MNLLSTVAARPAVQQPTESAADGKMLKTSAEAKASPEDTTFELLMDAKPKPGVAGKMEGLKSKAPLFEVRDFETQSKAGSAGGAMDEDAQSSKLSLADDDKSSSKKEPIEREDSKRNELSAAYQIVDPQVVMTAEIGVPLGLQILNFGRPVEPVSSNDALDSAESTDAGDVLGAAMQQDALSLGGSRNAAKMSGGFVGNGTFSSELPAAEKLGGVPFSTIVGGAAPSDPRFVDLKTQDSILVEPAQVDMSSLPADEKLQSTASVILANASDNKAKFAAASETQPLAGVSQSINAMNMGLPPQSQPADKADGMAVAMQQVSMQKEPPAAERVSSFTFQASAEDVKGREVQPKHEDHARVTSVSTGESEHFDFQQEADSESSMQKDQPDATSAGSYTVISTQPTTHTHGVAHAGHAGFSEAMKNADQTAAILQRVTDVAERMRSENRGQMELQLKLKDGQDLTIQLKMVDGELRPMFKTDSADLRQALEQGWGQFANTAKDGGIRLAAPVFESSGQGLANQNQSQNPQQNQQRQAQSGRTPQADFFTLEGQKQPEKSGAVKPVYPEKQTQAAGLSLFA